MATQQPFGFYDQSSSWVKHKPKQLQPTNTKSHKALKQSTNTTSVPKLPNELIIQIIKQADGGRFAHGVKSKSIFEFIGKYGSSTQTEWEIDWVNERGFEQVAPFFELLIHARRGGAPYIGITAPTALARLNNWEDWTLTKQELMEDEQAWFAEEEFDEEFQ